MSVNTDFDFDVDIFDNKISLLSPTASHEINPFPAYETDSVPLPTQSSSRFAQSSSSDITTALEKAVAPNTLNKAKWAMKIFKSWLADWRVRIDNVLKVLKDVDEMTKNDLNYCLGYFYSDVRKVEVSSPNYERNLFRLTVCFES